jgi:GT2 family glycosyltransferase
MKVAAITITYNDGYKFDEWYHHYLEYKDDLYMHIIVDNGSEKEYLETVYKYFTDSVIIVRETNGGCTGAYNDGIRHALNDPGVDAIMLIGNDIRLAKRCIPVLYSFLYSDKDYGMVSPVLLKKNSDTVIDCYGSRISSTLTMKDYNKGDNVSDLKPFLVVDTVMGGINLAKRIFYEKVGLQDENLFMYSDEVDMGIRAKKAGLKMAAVKTAVAWHAHINPSSNKTRNPYVNYLTGRNKIYLAGKHFGRLRKLLLFFYYLCHFLLLNLKYISKLDEVDFNFLFLKGLYKGLIGDMSLNGIIK